MNDKNLLIEGYQNPVPLSLSCFLCYVKDDKFSFWYGIIYIPVGVGVGLGWGFGMDILEVQQDSDGA